MTVSEDERVTHGTRSRTSKKSVEFLQEVKESYLVKLISLSHDIPREQIWSVNHYVTL